MKIRSLAALTFIFFSPFIVLGQTWHGPAAKDKVAQIFHAYTATQPEFYGFFDSTESIFLVHLDSVVQSPFDSSCFLSKGKAWHRGQQRDFVHYITVDTCIQIHPPDPADSSEEEPFWALQETEMKIPGNTLWKCEGEFTMSENQTRPFSGKFIGTFTIYFYYNTKSSKIQRISESNGFGQEPAFSFVGFWKSYAKQTKGSIAFFFANTHAQTRDDGALKLPDLRFQMDGSSSFSNIAIFPQGTQMPPANWYQ